MHTLGQPQELFAELVCLLELCPVIINRLESQQRPEALLAISHLLAELARPGVNTFEFWGSMALEDHEGRAQGQLQREFLRSTCERVWQGVEQMPALWSGARALPHWPSAQWRADRPAANREVPAPCRPASV